MHIPYVHCHFFGHCISDRISTNVMVELLKPKVDMSIVIFLVIALVGFFRSPILFGSRMVI